MPEKPAVIQVCPCCGSYERHRLAFYMLNGKLGLLNKTLHVAPEKFIERWLRSISSVYASIDVSSDNAMRHMDLTKLKFSNTSFDLIWCSHVLEHIENDTLAIEEIFRVLAPGGNAIIQVPIYGENTYENSKIISPQDRLKHFKQTDHVRLYGLDIATRLTKVGFELTVLDILKIPPCDRKLYGLDYPSTGEIFVCKKPKVS